MGRITHGRVAKPGADGLIDQSLTNNHVSKQCKALYYNVLHMVNINQWSGVTVTDALTLQTASRGGDDPPHPRPLEINFHYHVLRDMDVLPGFDSPTLDY